jgi:hypothetical protein
MIENPILCITRGGWLLYSILFILSIEEVLKLNIFVSIAENFTIAPKNNS